MARSPLGVGHCGATAGAGSLPHSSLACSPVADLPSPPPRQELGLRGPPWQPAWLPADLASQSHHPRQSRGAGGAGTGQGKGPWGRGWPARGAWGDGS